jgi:hypothetical protein
MSTFNSKFIVQTVVVIVILGLAFWAYQFFLNRNKAAATEPGLTRVTADSVIPPAADEFLNLLLSLQKIDFQSSSLFTNPKFTNLEDFSTPLPDLDSGRLNPFLPPSTTERPFFTFDSADDDEAASPAPVATSTAR